MWNTAFTYKHQNKYWLCIIYVQNCFLSSHWVNNLQPYFTRSAVRALSFWVCVGQSLALSLCFHCSETLSLSQKKGALTCVGSTHLAGLRPPWRQYFFRSLWPSPYSLAIVLLQVLLTVSLLLDFCPRPQETSAIHSMSNLVRMLFLPLKYFSPLCSWPSFKLELQRNFLWESVSSLYIIQQV